MIRLPLNADGELTSQLTQALLGRGVDLSGGDPEETHLYTAMATSWRATGDAASAVMDALRQIQALRPDANFEPEDLVRSFKALVYAATETFDIYHALAPSRLVRGRIKAEVKAIRAYQDAVKQRRDLVGNMCNRLKHAAREIVPCRIVSQATGRTTFVYRINAAYGSVQRADELVHRDGPFASFERSVHEFVHGLLRADCKAADLVSQLADNSDQLTLAGPSRLRLAPALESLVARAPVVALSETGRFDGVVREGGDIVLTRVAAEKVPEPTTRTMRMTVDEVARSNQLIL